MTDRASSIVREIEETRTELSLVRERLAEHGRALEDARLRMMAAETPLADRELHASAETHRRLERERRDLEERLTGLEDELRRARSGPVAGRA